jgi:hypothetical protein
VSDERGKIRSIHGVQLATEPLRVDYPVGNGFGA